MTVKDIMLTIVTIAMASGICATVHAEGFDGDAWAAKQKAVYTHIRHCAELAKNDTRELAKQDCDATTLKKEENPLIDALSDALKPEKDMTMGAFAKKHFKSQKDGLAAMGMVGAAVNGIIYIEQLTVIDILIDRQEAQKKGEFSI